MTEGYLQILVDSLEKKMTVLSEIKLMEKEQFEMAMSEVIDFEKYDKSVDLKSKYIDELNRLDDGFTNTYELVRDELNNNPQKHKETIEQLKDMIRQITDMVVEIQAMEARNKDAISLAIGKRRTDLKGKHVSTAAALKYYKAMSRMNDVDPQLLDHKK